MYNENLTLKKIEYKGQRDDYIKTVAGVMTEGVAKMEEDFYLKIIREALGREINPEQDAKRFSRNFYPHLDNKETISLDGIEIGEIKRHYFRIDSTKDPRENTCTIEFIPFEPIIEKENGFKSEDNA